MDLSGFNIILCLENELNVLSLCDERILISFMQVFTNDDNVLLPAKLCIVKLV